MKHFGAKTARVYPDRKSCRKLVEPYATGTKEAMKIQLELEDQGATFDTSSVLAAFSPELNKLQLEKQEEEARMREKAAKHEQENSDRIKREEAQRQASLEQRERVENQERARVKREQEAGRVDVRQRLKEDDSLSSSASVRQRRQGSKEKESKSLRGRRN